MASKQASETPVDELHLDDFLNSLEGTGRVEILAAYGAKKRKARELKKPLDAWKADFDKFEHATP